MLRAAIGILLLALAFAAPAYAARTVALDAADATHAFVVGTDGALYHAPPGGFLERLGGADLRAGAGRGGPRRGRRASPSSPAASTTALPSTRPRRAGVVSVGTARDRARGLARRDQGRRRAAPRLRARPGRRRLARRADRHRLERLAEPGRHGRGRARRDPRRRSSGSCSSRAAPTATSGPRPRTAPSRLERLDLGRRRRSPAIRRPSAPPTGASRSSRAAPTARSGTRRRPSPGGAVQPARASAATLVGNPASVRRRPGPLHVFALSTDNALWQTYQDPPGGPGRPGGRSVATFTGDPAAIRDSGGRLHVVVPGAGNVLWSVEQTRRPLDLARVHARSAPLGAGPAATARRRVVPTPDADPGHRRSSSRR